MNSKKLITLAILSLILIIGAYLRLYRIRDYMTFLGDEGRDVLVVKRMIIDHKFTLLGPTASVAGFFLGPIYYYFMIPFLLIFNLDPVGPAVMVALFGIAAIFLVYKTGKDFFSETTGLIAALLYAVSPVVINYSHSSWNPNLMPFFSLLIIYLCWKVVVKNKWRNIFWIGTCLGIALQLHYLAAFLGFAVFLYLIINGKLNKTKEYLLGILGFITGLSPFLFFEIRHNFPNTISIFNFVFHGKDVNLDNTSFLKIIPDVTVRLFERLVTNNNLTLAYILLIFSFIIFFYSWVLKIKDNNASKTHLLIFLWGAVGILLFGFYKRGIYDYYFGFLFPLPFILVGLALSYFYKNIFGKIIIIIITFLLFWINWQARPFIFVPNRQLNQAIVISRFVLEKTEGKPYNFALITGQNSDHAYRYFFEIWNRQPLTIENEQNDPQRKTVAKQLLIVCEKIDCQPLGNSLWEVAGFGRAEIAGSWNVSVVKVYKLIHYQGK